MEELYDSYIKILHVVLTSSSSLLSPEEKEKKQREHDHLVSIRGRWDERMFPRRIQFKSKKKIPAFVINLNKRWDRYQSFQQNVEKKIKSFEFQRMDAVNGHELPIENKFYRTIIKPRNYQRIHKKLIYGETGCMMSHLKCYRYMIDHHIPYMAIFEDDACFRNKHESKRLEKDIQTLLYHLPTNFSILFLNEWDNFGTKNFNDYFYSVTNDRTLESYIISLSFAKALYEYGTMYMDASDRNMPHCRDKYQLHPFLVVKQPYFIQVDRRNSDIR